MRPIPFLTILGLGLWPLAGLAQTTSAPPDVLTLEAAMSTAAENNVEVDILQSNVERAREQSARARTDLFPKATGSARVQQIDHDRAVASGRGVAERDVRAGVGISQVLYDESVGLRVRSSRHTTRQTMFEEERVRLDAMAVSGAGFLRYVLSQALCDIERNNLKSTRDHLELARKRYEAGATGQDEVLRWEAEEARQEGGLTAAEADIEKARVDLNRTMGVDAESQWIPQPVPLADNAFNFLDEAGVPALLGMDRNTPQFREFSVLRALDRAPELKAMDEAITAQRLAINQRRRSGFIPQVSASASYERLIDQDFAGTDFSDQLASAGLPVAKSSLDDNEWVVGIAASLPLFESGARKHDVAADEAQLDTLELTRVRISQAIEQRVHTSAYSLHSTHRRIGFARVAADRARRSYRLVSEKYDRGATPIIDVLDAQSQVLREEIGEAVARNAYLQSILEYQRAIAWFAMFQPPEAREAWVNHLKRYLDLPTGAKHDEH